MLEQEGARGKVVGGDTAEEADFAAGFVRGKGREEGEGGGEGCAAHRWKFRPGC